jgi:quercetin dioxygenase-like cupin family protein
MTFREKTMHAFNKLVGWCLVVAALSVPLLGHAQGHMDIVSLEKINWMPCDPNAADPSACQLAYFKGDPAKEANYKMLKAKAGFAFPPHWHNNSEYLVMTKGVIVIAAEGGQEQDQTLGVGDFLFIPARRVHWGSCPQECIFYLGVDGPDSYIDATKQRP